MLLSVLAPLGLLLWAGISGHNLIFRKLVTYWRVSSLLMITVYLLAAAAPIAFLTGVAARVLIPLSLGWPFGEFAEERRLARAFNRWRQVVSVYCLIGVLFNLPLLRCTLTWQLQPPCTAWLGPVMAFTELFHPGVSVEVLGRIAWVALGLYLAVLLFYALTLRNEKFKANR